MSMQKSRRCNVMMLASMIMSGFLMIALWHQERIITEFTTRFPNIAAKKGTITPKPHLSFYEIAVKYGTDKVNIHHYEEMYEHKFAPIRHKPLKMLEIGLGCGQAYGPGASYFTWLSYFSHVDLYFIEYNGDCAHTWSNSTSQAHIYIGDQSDPVFLNQFISDTGGEFDVIIDDGGHTMDQQRTSLEVLWKAVRDGGMYFVEDLATSYEVQYGGGFGVETSFMEGLKRLMDDVNLRDADAKGLPSGWWGMSREVEKIEFTQECVAFTKRVGKKGGSKMEVA